MRVEIYDEEGVWAGSGRWIRGRIEDCDAVLGEDQDETGDIYAALDRALGRAIKAGHWSAEARGYTAYIEETPA